MNGWRLALAMLRRDWRAGEWRVLFVALLLAVGSIATVGLFADRVRMALQQESHALLGADLRISSTRPLPAAYRSEALRRGLQVLETYNFPSMVGDGKQSVLCEVLAVQPGYPLRGRISIDDGATHVAQMIPARGTLWVDRRLMLRLGLQRGDMVTLGRLHLRVAAEVVRDVDQSLGFASFAPRVTINAADLAASGLVQNGSRINYRLLIAGGQQQVDALRAWLKPRLGLGERLEDVRDARPEIRTALERAEHFLGLAALTAVTLAGVALALAARRFILRHLDACAVMRCLGASQPQVLALFLYQFLLLGLAAVLLGGAFGYAAQALLVQMIPAMRDANLPLPSMLPLWQAAASGIALLLGFAFLPLWQLKRVSPLRVIRRELGLPPMSTDLLYAAGVAVLCVLFLWQAGSLKLGLTVLGGLAGGLLLFGLLAWLLLHALARLPLRNRHVFADMARHARSNALQVVALSLGGMALLLLTVVRADLLQNWRQQMPPDVPNRFLVNIQPDQRAALQQFFAQQGLAQPQLFPMVRGRLIAISGRTVTGDSYAEPRARQLAEREFNLSWSAALPVGNQVVAGAWWLRKGGGEAAGHPPASPLRGQAVEPQLSVEQGIADTLGIHLGDMLTYDVAGSQFTAKVSNLRKLEWDSMRVNFFVIAAPGMLEDFPASYITSFHLPAARRASGDALIRQFPNLLLIDTEAIIGQVRHVMDEIAQTLSAVFLFTLLAGLAVLYAVLLATQDERRQHAAILRTLGADGAYLRRLHLTEFAVLGALSGMFAAAGAGLLGWVLAQRVLDIPYAPGGVLWLAGIGGGVLLVMLSGWLVTRRVAQLPPLQVLQSV
jgi:putative ABC transport system permease protein